MEISEGGRGREALLVYKQSYGCFEMVLSPEAKQDKFMTALRWFLPRENNCVINRKIKFKIFAIRFVCGKFLRVGRRKHCGVNAALSTGRRGRRPLRVWAKFFALSVYSQIK